MKDKDLNIYDLHKKNKYPNAPFAQVLYDFMQNKSYKVSIYATPTTLLELIKAYGPVNDLPHVPKIYKPTMIYVQVDKAHFVQNVFTGLFHKDMLL